MRRLRTKQLIFIGYFLGTFILGKIGVFKFSWSFLQFVLWDFVWWFSGAVLGGYFIKLDQLFYVYFTQAEAPFSLEIKSLLKQKQKNKAWNLLRQRVGEQRLAFRSALFQVVWIVLAFFTLTSTASVFGKTLVMAIGFHLLIDEWEAILAGQSIAWLFWQIKRPITPKEQKGFLWIMTGVFCLLSLLLI